jgi:hypothetical protein
MFATEFDPHLDACVAFYGLDSGRDKGWCKRSACRKARASAP